jgi:hypothetical protein
MLYNMEKTKQISENVSTILEINQEINQEIFLENDQMTEISIESNRDVNIDKKISSKCICFNYLFGYK